MRLGSVWIEVSDEQELLRSNDKADQDAVCASHRPEELVAISLRGGIGRRSTILARHQSSGDYTLRENP